MSATALRLPGGEAVSFRRLEEELTRQLRALKGPDESPVVRARMSNLVIFCDNPERAAELERQLPAIVAAHPARVILLIGEHESAGEDLSAMPQVWKAVPGSRHPVYTEQITVHAQGEACERLPFVVRGLVVGDLPTNFWWANGLPPAFAGGMFLDLAELAEQVIYDSADWEEPASGFATIGFWVDQFEAVTGQVAWRSAADLNWRRLKTWRRLLGQALDPEWINSICEVQIEHGIRGGSAAWLLTSWLAERLGWQPCSATAEADGGMAWRLVNRENSIRVRLQPCPGQPLGLRWLRLAGSASQAIHVVQVDERRLGITAEGLALPPHTLSTPPQSLADLVGRQLSDRERDPIFRAAIQRARELADVAGDEK
jgi:glucose-6-phosphate dehydrogenase assembly protein OpcA